MTIEQLHQFYTLSQCQNFTLAANQLYISQPALSKSIQSLEKELGFSLLHRSTRTVSLTAEGEAFARTCGDIINTLRTGINEARSASGIVSGNIIFGVRSDYYDPIAMELIAQLKESYPGITVQLVFLPPNGLLRALDNNKVDFIISCDWPRSSGLKHIKLKESHLCAVVPATHALADRDTVDFDEFKHNSFIAISHKISGKEHDTVIELARKNNLSPHLAYDAGSFPELLMMVSNNIGTAILPKEYASLANDSIKFLPLRSGETQVFNLLWRENDNPCVTAVVDTVHSMGLE